MTSKRQRHSIPEGLLNIFSASRYQFLLQAAKSLPLTGSRAAIKHELRQTCPDAPGVYGLINREGELIYAGMSRGLRRRLISYFSSRRGRKKETRLARQTSSLLWQPVAHELVAALRERELIRRFRPARNVQGHPTRMKLGYLTLSDPQSGSFSLQPRISGQQSTNWGPVPMTKFVRLAVEELNLQFRLRDCPRETPMRFRNAPVSDDLPEFTPCMRADLGTCLAPCAAGCTRRQYLAALRDAKAFLNGGSRACLKQLKGEMVQAGEQRNYEKAARLRDRLRALQRLDFHLRRFHDWTNEASFIYPVQSSFDRQEWWLTVIRGLVVDAVARPERAADRRAFGEKFGAHLRQLGSGSKKEPITGPDEFESARILFRWFRRFPEEAGRCLRLAKGGRLCQSSPGPQ